MGDNICNTLTQRRAFLSLSMPPIRYNGLVNPYVNDIGAQIYKPSDLDMRRKAEILQYKKNSTQTNRLTKSQKFAQAIGRTVNFSTGFIGTINGTILTVSKVTQGTIIIGQSLSGYGIALGTIVIGQSQTTGKTGTYTISISQNIPTSTVIYANTNTTLTTCENDLYIPSLSSSCDVPGPVVTLYYDPTVPLYNYVQNVVSLGLINSEDTGKWTDSTNDNIIAYDSIETTLVDLAISKIDSPTTIFSINSPIGIYIDGTTSSSSSGNISLSNITVSVYYNDSNYLLTSIEQPTIVTLNELKNQAVSYTANPSSTFSGIKYIGNLNITNLVLPTMYGYVYKIKVKFRINTNATGINTRVYMNFTTGNNVNCAFTAPTAVSPQIPYSISGI